MSNVPNEPAHNCPAWCARRHPEDIPAHSVDLPSITAGGAAFDLALRQHGDTEPTVDLFLSLGDDTTAIALTPVQARSLWTVLGIAVRTLGGAQ